MKKDLPSSFSFRVNIACPKKLIPAASLLFFVFVLIAGSVSAQQLQPSALRQIQSLMDEKASRTPAEKKISSQILYAFKMRTGQPLTTEVATLRTDVEKDADGRIKIDIDAAVTPQLLNELKALGSEIIFSSEKFGNIVAKIPLDKVEQIAALDAVKHINYWMPPVHGSNLSGQPDNYKKINAGDFERIKNPLKRTDEPAFNIKYNPDFATRAGNVSKQLSTALKQMEYDDKHTFIGSVTSEGDITHKAALARTVFGTNGSGVKIGVISDSYDTRSTGTNASDDIARGDLPGPGNPNGFTTPVTVLLDYPNGSDEGRAMLQIIHDLAPGAQLYFATAFVSQASFAQQILDLRTAGCDIIVDDMTYFAEGVFQDDNVAQAVNTVTASGALYFSSAGNAGNKNDGTAGVWEGDFVGGGAVALFPGGTVHDFGGTYYNVITGNTGPVTLKWSDPLGLSGNDYDIFVTNSAGTTVYDASTNIQDGNDNPYEIFGGSFIGERIYILKKTGAAVRALHLDSFRGELNFNTPGVTSGHNAAASAYTVAATPAAVANSRPGSPTGPYPGVFTAVNKVEVFSSDGPRRMFFNPNGTEITAGNVLFATNGGTLLQKPDITAADGVVTTLPGTSDLNPFFGTSAAAPHAAAIAALIKSKLPALTPEQIRTAITSSAIDIETPGVDRDAGAGIIMAYEALIAAGATECPLPTITCPANITVDNTANQCGANVSFSATASNNCPGTTISYSPASGSFFPAGTTTVTATATDASGNTASCTFTVTVVDAQNPTITCPANITVDNTANQCGANVSFSATASDNCPGTTISYSPASGTFFPIGTTTVTATAVDASGNTASCTFTVTVVDAQNPSITCPANITVNNAANQCGANVNFRATASDNCPGTTISYSPASGSFFPVGTTTVTATATDAAGHTASCTFTVKVVDAQNPTINCPANITQNNDPGQCGAVVTYTATASDNCPGTTISYSPASGSFFPVGTTTVTATATDAAGNTATCTFSVTVVDAQPPTITCPANITVNNDVNKCGAVVTYAATASDNCPGTSISYSPASGSFFPVGTTTVTATASDVAGHTASCTFTVTVMDAQNPTITCPTNITVDNTTNQCGANVSFSTTASDNCPGTTISYSPASGSFFPVGTTTVTATATDAAGHTATCTFTVTVVDAQNPSITCPANITVNNDADQCGAVVSFAATASDNCPGTTISYSPASGSFFPAGTTTVTVTATDAGGNTATCSFTVTVVDNEAPVPPSLPNVVEECAATPTAPTAIDNCAGPVPGTTTTVFPVTTQGITVVTWTFTDGNGNTSTAVQNIFINDVTPPVPPSSLPTLVSECGVTPTAPTAIDNCAGTVTGTTFTSFPVTAQGNTVITWLFTDGNGNISTATQTVVVNDITPPLTPVLPTITAECSVTVTPPTTTDNCADTVTGFTIDPLTYTALGTYTIYWIFSDGHGNLAVAKQTVIIDDVTAPVPPSLPTITAECSATPAAPIAQDNCAGPVTGTTTTVFPITAQGTTVITWTFNDGNGNISTATQTVILHDVTAPTISCPASITGAAARINPNNNNEHSGADNHCSKFITVPNATFSDNCGVPTLLTWTLTGATTASSASTGINQVGGRTFNAGVTTITYTVTDAVGNTASCSFTVTVTESVLPSISCPSNKKVNADYNHCYATNVNLGNPAVSDNCGVASVTNNAPSQFPVGITVVTWTVTDISGNTRSCTQTVTVVDNVYPVVSCPANMTICKVANDTYTIPAMTRSDNCGIAGTTYQITGATTRNGTGTDASGLFNLGQSTIQWTVTDVNGKVSTCTTKVTITTNDNCLVVRVTPPTQGPAPKGPEVKEPGKDKLDVIIKDSKLDVIAWPNPTEYYFNIKVKSAGKETVEIRMYDMLGKEVQQNRGAPEKTYRFGNHVVSGMYIIEVRQGGQIVTIKVVKQ